MSLIRDIRRLQQDAREREDEIGLKVAIVVAVLFVVVLVIGCAFVLLSLSIVLGALR